MNLERLSEATVIMLLALLSAAALTPADKRHSDAPKTLNAPEVGSPPGLGSVQPTPADAEAEPDAPAVTAPAAGVFESPIPPAPVVDGPKQSAAGVRQQSADCATCAPAARYTPVYSQPVGPLRRWLGRRR